MADLFLDSIIKTIMVKFPATTVGGTHLMTELKDLKNSLSKIQAIIIDSENKKAKNRYLSDWLTKLKDAIYDVEDVLDEYVSGVLQDKVVEKEASQSKVRNSFSLNAYILHFKAIHKIREIRERIEEIVDAGSRYNLQNLGSNIDVVNVNVNVRDITSSLVRPSYVVGRETHKERIIGLLVHKDDPALISIVGMGGIGKTTLAQLVYNDEIVNKHFQMKIWVCGPDDLDMSKLMKEIIKSESNENLSDCTIDKLKPWSQNILKDKTFLLILDDLWNEDGEIWSKLKELLSYGSTGSKILMTTRNMLDASMAGPIYTYMLPLLDNEESRSLFVKLAFKEGQDARYPVDLMSVGYEIVRKCKGLPLALITLGSLLYMNTNIDHWVSIRDNEMWESSILPALKLSYEELPSYLKHCFACLSLFPKDYEFSGIDLIQLWMAQGLITPSNESEEIGERWVKELCSRAFIQQVSKVYDLYAGFKMHDLVHDLARFTAQNECWSVNFQTQNIPKMVRHVSFYDSGDLSGEEVVKTLLDVNTSLRTIMFPMKGVGPSNNYFVKTCIARFKYLRLLDLSDSSFETLPSFIGKLKLLRLLTLSDNCHIKTLPNSICKLHNLQTLRLFGCSNLEKLPRDIENLTMLRFLYITTTQMSLEIGSLISLRFLSISSCRNLKSLDEKVMERLTTLRTLWIKDCKSLVCLPSGLKHLTVLKIDGCPELGKRCEPQTGEDWHKIRHVREITVDSQKIQSLTN